MRIAYKMELEKREISDPSVNLVRYDSSYKDEYKRIYNECYHEMREALDIKPYDYIQDDSFFEEGMENVYLLINAPGEIIGGVALKDDEVDDLIVNRKYQGRGYGTKILTWAISKMNFETIILHVADWNKKAISLYEKLGFVIVERIEF